MHNHKRIVRMQTLRISELKAIIDRGSLSSTAASYWLKRRFGIIHIYVHTFE